MVVSQAKDSVFMVYEYFIHTRVKDVFNEFAQKGKNMNPFDIYIYENVFFMHMLYSGLCRLLSLFR